MNRQKKLDNIFSKFIRLRDTDEFGYGRCISCGRIKPYSELDNGHYVNREEMTLRYDEKNCNAQCRHCNYYEEGNALGYTRGLIEKYGKDVLLELEVKKSRQTKLTPFEYDVLYKEYREKAKEEAAKKSFIVKI